MALNYPILISIPRFVLTAPDCGGQDRMAEAQNMSVWNIGPRGRILISLFCGSMSFSSLLAITLITQSLLQLLNHNRQANGLDEEK